MSNIVGRGLGLPGEGSIVAAGLGLGAAVGLTGHAAQAQNAEGSLKAREGSSGYPIRRYPEPTRPPRRLKLTGSAEQPTDAAGRLTLIARPLAAAAQTATADSRVAAALKLGGVAHQDALASGNAVIVLNQDEADLEALLLLV